MSYQILKCQLPGQPMLIVLKGEGEHEGTLANITERRFGAELARVRIAAREQGHKVAEFTLLRDSAKGSDGPEVMRAMGSFFDREFQLAHLDRLSREHRASQPNDATVT